MQVFARVLQCHKNVPLSRGFYFFAQNLSHQNHGIPANLISTLIGHNHNDAEAQGTIAIDPSSYTSREGAFLLGARSPHGWKIFYIYGDLFHFVT